MPGFPAFPLGPASDISDRRRWQAAQSRYEAEASLYQRERERYMAARARDGRGGYDRRDYDTQGYAPQGYAPDGYAPSSGVDCPARTALTVVRIISLTSLYRGVTGRAFAVSTTGRALANHGTALVTSAVQGAMLRPSIHVIVIRIVSLTLTRR